MWLVVVNPVSGKGKAVKKSKSFCNLLDQQNVAYNLLNLTSKNETIKELTARLKNPSYKAVVAIGGDGLVNLCLQELAQTEIPLAVIPAGTGNDFARAIGVYGEPITRILSHLINTQPVQIDIGKISKDGIDKLFVQVLSSGFDAEVNERANNMTWPRGKIKYVVAILQTLRKFTPIKYEIQIDEEKIFEEAMLVTVANGENYGGGMKICPGASNSDGLFNVLLVQPVSKLVLLTIFPKVFFGRHIPHPKIKTYIGKQIKIIGKTTAYADGEFMNNLPIQISNVPKGLKVWVMK